MKLNKTFFVILILMASSFSVYSENLSVEMKDGYIHFSGNEGVSLYHEFLYSIYQSHIERYRVEPYYDDHLKEVIKKNEGYIPINGEITKIADLDYDSAYESIHNSFNQDFGNYECGMTEGIASELVSTELTYEVCSIEIDNPFSIFQFQQELAKDPSIDGFWGHKEIYFLEKHLSKIMVDALLNSPDLEYASSAKLDLVVGSKLCAHNPWSLDIELVECKKTKEYKTYKAGLIFSNVIPGLYCPARVEDIKNSKKYISRCFIDPNQLLQK